MPHVVLTTFGSLGDLHPFIAIGRALVARGHHVTIATHPGYRARVERVGLRFHAVRPELPAEAEMADFMRRALDLRRGSEFIVRDVVLPHVRDSYQDLLAGCASADAIVSHVLAFTAPLVAERLGVPRIHTVLQPMMMLSAHDPPVAPAVPFSEWLRTRGPRFWKIWWRLGAWVSRPWFRAVDELRAEIGLAPGGHAMFGAHSPRLNLVLLPEALAPRQPDWPPNTVVTGGTLWDRDEEGGATPPALRAFLDAGPAPVVFTLGSSGVWVADGFYDAAAAAAERLGVRAVLLTGPAGRLRERSPGVIEVPYAPHSEVLPRASVIVHHGGIGTLIHALRAGMPSLIVPFSHDQPDNAARCQRLGIARVLPRAKVSAKTLERELRVLLADHDMAWRAAQVGVAVRAEDGASAAADAIEGVLADSVQAARS